MEPRLRKCLHCREKAVASRTLDRYETDLEHDGRTYHLELHDFAVRQCSHCGAISLNDIAGERLVEALRSAAGLLSPAEIRGHREALGLMQKDLARLMQISESTLSRWETGAQIQQKCMDRFLRGVFQVPEFRRFLEGATTLDANSMSDPVASSS